MLAEFESALQFAPYAMIAGAAVAVLDFLSSQINGGKSVLGLRYEGLSTLKWMMVWTVGTGVGGFPGAMG